MQQLTFLVLSILSLHVTPFTFPVGPGRSTRINFINEKFPFSISTSHDPQIRKQRVTIFAEGGGSSEDASTVDDEVTLSMISSLKVSTLENDSVKLGSLIDLEQTTVLTCLSHFGDFNAWEMAQQYITALDDGNFDDDCDIILVGIGSSYSCQKFASDLGLNEGPTSRIKLVSDETGSVTKALGCYQGWLTIDKKHAERWPSTDISPYIKLFGMIFGIGSPGTIGRVLNGYFGDKYGEPRNRMWVVKAILQGSEKGRVPKINEEAFKGIPEDSGLRPFELATLRAQTGIHIVLNWGKLGPKDGNLFTRMGGTFVFKNSKCVYQYFDKGILTYAPMEEIISSARK